MNSLFENIESSGIISYGGSECDIFHVSNNIFKDIDGIPIGRYTSRLRIKNMKIEKNKNENLLVSETPDPNTAIWVCMIQRKLETMQINNNLSFCSMLHYLEF